MSLPARAILVFGALAGCGRIDFDRLPAGPDAVDDAAPDTEPSCPVGGCVVNHGWSRRFGSPSVDFGFDLARSATARQVFMTGLYTGGGVDFGGGVVTSAGLHDTMVAIYDDDGAFVTARGYGGPGFEEGFGIAIAANGDIHLGGRGQNMARFDGPLLAGDAAMTDVFAARFTASGGHLWSALHGGAGEDIASDVAIDDAGATYLSGTFQQSVSFGGPPRVAGGGTDAFVVSYNATGAYRWDRTWGSAVNELAVSVALDPTTNTVLVAGRFGGTVDFGVGARVSSGGTDGYVVAFDATTGTTRWDFTWGAAGDDGCNGITIDGDGNIYLAAYYSDSITLGTTTLTSVGEQDIALFSLTAAGTVRWATSHGGAGIDRGIKLALGPSGELVTGGIFRQEATLGGEVVTSQGDTDAFVMATSAASGNRLWTRAFGSAGQDEVQAVVVDELGRVYATGAFSASVSFGGAPLTSAGNLDTFLIRLDPEIVVPTQ